MPSVLCLNDNGRRMMDCQREKTGTLRAQEHGHQPLVLFENHGIDGRYTGPHPVSPTLPTRMGTGGNNTPLVGAYGSPRRRWAGSPRTAETGSVFPRKWGIPSPRRTNTAFVNLEANRGTARIPESRDRKAPLTLFGIQRRRGCISGGSCPSSANGFRGSRTAGRPFPGPPTPPDTGRWATASPFPASCIFSKTWPGAGRGSSACCRDDVASARNPACAFVAFGE